MELIFCEECQTEVKECEHLRPDRENNMDYLNSRRMRGGFKSNDKPKSLSEWFRAKPHRDDWLDAPDPWSAFYIIRVRDGIIMPDGSCGPRCICAACMKKKLDDPFG